MTHIRDAGCFCTGPLPGQPECPCMMRSKGIFQRDGRWVQPERDLGPVGQQQTLPSKEWALQSIDGCLNEAFDKANPELAGQPRGLSCSCPKCSLR